jgi:hypothetical protein
MNIKKSKNYSPNKKWFFLVLWIQI